MIRNIKSPSQTDLVFIHCHLNPPGASQTKITLLSLVTLKYNLKFCMKAAAAGLAAWAAGSKNQHKKWHGAKCQHSLKYAAQSLLVSLSPCQCALSAMCRYLSRSAARCQAGWLCSCPQSTWRHGQHHGGNIHYLPQCMELVAQ